MHFGAFAFFLGGTDRPPPSAAEFHLNVKGLWTPTTLVMWINGSENQLSCGTGPGRTLLLLNGVVAHLPYCDNGTGSLSAYHIPTISCFQILLEMCLPTSLHGKNQFPITCYQTYKFEGCEIPRKRILRVHAYMSNKTCPLTFEFLQNFILCQNEQEIKWLAMNQKMMVTSYICQGGDH